MLKEDFIKNQKYPQLFTDLIELRAGNISTKDIYKDLPISIIEFSGASFSKETGNFEIGGSFAGKDVYIHFSELTHELGHLAECDLHEIFEDDFGLNALIYDDWDKAYFREKSAINFQYWLYHMLMWNTQEIDVLAVDVGNGHLISAPELADPYNEEEFLKLCDSISLKISLLNRLKLDIKK